LVIINHFVDLLTRETDNSGTGRYVVGLMPTISLQPRNDFLPSLTYKSKRASVSIDRLAVSNLLPQFLRKEGRELILHSN